MDKIIDKGGHFCLQLKRNQRTAFEDVDLFFKDLEEKNKTDAGYQVGHVKCIGMARLTRIIGETTTTEAHYHLLVAETTADKYMELARAGK